MRVTNKSCSNPISIGGVIIKPKTTKDVPEAIWKRYIKKKQAADFIEKFLTVKESAKKRAKLAASVHPKKFDDTNRTNVNKDAIEGKVSKDSKK